MVYNPGQVKVIYPYVKGTPEWFLLGGPADGNEAQCVREHWPDINVLACEPFGKMHDWQVDNDFPTTNSFLLPYALSDIIDEAVLSVYPDRRSTMDRAEYYTAAPEDDQIVCTTTLDQLSEDYGPFTKAILWLDIEGSELKALYGAIVLFRTRAIDLVNLEVLPNRRPDDLKGIEHFMGAYGFILVHTWDRQPEWENRIYVRS